jgi:endonuclease-8
VPEGDTIHRTASRLAAALVGGRLVRFEAPHLAGDRPRPGTEVTAVDAVGKHLLIAFADGLALRTHMRMSGSWHLYRTGERWSRPRHLMRALVEVPGWVAVCFSAPVVETYRPAHPGGVLGTDLDPLGHLGPDLCGAGLTDADVEECVRRMGTVPAPTAGIGEALLDQRVACGVGNVYKSEVLYACRLDPFTPVTDLPEPVRRRLVTVAARMLRANLGGGPRTTVGPAGSGAVAVYGRRGRPCRRCGTPIRSRRQGEQARTTYWCPRCQVHPRPPERSTAPADTPSEVVGGLAAGTVNRPTTSTETASDPISEA